MSDENQIPPNEPAQASEDDRPITKAELSKMLGDYSSKINDQIRGVKDSVFADVRRTFKGNGKERQPEPTSNTADVSQAPAQTSNDDALQRMRAENNFHRALSRYQVSDKIYSRMEKSFIAESPQDPSQWVQEYIADLGINANPQATVGAVTPTPPAPNRPAVSGDSPGGAVKYTPDTPLLRLSNADRAELAAKHGPHWIR